MAEEGDDLEKGANQRGTGNSFSGGGGRSLARSDSEQTASIVRRRKGPRAEERKERGRAEKALRPCLTAGPTIEVTRTGDVLSWLNIPTEFLPNEQ